MLSLLFQPGFSTVENATKDAGRGVGMNLMADLMRQIGGRVGVATAPGRYHPSNGDTAGPPEAGRRYRGRMMDTNTRQSTLKLMIVDDSNIIRRRIERSQQIDRLEVVGAAANGRDAVDLFKRTQADVVTMDFTMPEMDGIECVREADRHQSERIDPGSLSARRQGDGRRGHREGCQRLSMQALHGSTAQRCARRAAAGGLRC